MGPEIKRFGTEEKRNEQTLQGDLPHGDVDRRACGGALFKCDRIWTVWEGL